MNTKSQISDQTVKFNPLNSEYEVGKILYGPAATVVAAGDLGNAIATAASIANVSLIMSPFNVWLKWREAR